MFQTTKAEKYIHIKKERFPIFKKVLFIFPLNSMPFPAIEAEDTSTVYRLSNFVVVCRGKTVNEREISVSDLESCGGRGGRVITV